MKINTPNTQPNTTPVTHEGGRAARITPEQELRRTVMACLLWEDTFYESGEDVSKRIAGLVPQVDPGVVAALAIEARTRMNLRHVPLFLCRELARNKTLKPETLTAVIQRPDEMTEFLAIYWKNGREKLAASVKKGLAAAFPTFSAYSLAKYNQTDKPIKLRDVLFLTHPKPLEGDYSTGKGGYMISYPSRAEQEETWKKLVDGTLESPDTWEVALSGGADKKETWERLIAEKKLGALALLRNLRNMLSVNVDPDVIRDALAKADVRRVFPFRFIAAARYAPMLEPNLEAALFRSIAGTTGLLGNTIVLVDVSGSMDAPVSAKSDMKRFDAAAGVAMLARELCVGCRVFTFSSGLVEIGPRRGFALRDAIINSQPHTSTMLAAAINALPSCDRLIVISDEQAHDSISSLVKADKAYMLNVGSFKNGVGYGGKWTNISGWSEAVIRYIQEIENVDAK